MTGLLRIIAFIGGIFLLITTASITVFNDESAKVYWVSSYDFNRPDGFYFMLFDNEHPEPRLIRDTSVRLTYRHWWSVDGEWFFYIRDESEQLSLWRVRPTGGNPEHVLNDIAPYDYYDFESIPSPNGDMMAIRTHDVDEFSGLVVTDVEGNHQRRLVTTAETITSNFWSPDSQWVFYVTQGTRAVDTTTYRVHINGGTPQLVYNGEINDPIWSPDGQWMVFAERSREVGYLNKISADGSVINELIAGDGYSYNLQGWLGNEWVVFEAYLREPQPYRIRSDGTGVAPLMDTSGVIISWSEDESTAFVGWDGEAGTCVLFQIDIAMLDRTCLQVATDIFGFYWRHRDESSAVFAAWPAYKSSIYFQTSIFVANRDGSNIHEFFSMNSGDIEWHYAPMPDYEWDIIWIPPTDDKEQWRVRRSDGHKVALPSGYDPIPSPLLNWATTSDVRPVGVGMVGILGSVALMGIRWRRQGT